MNKICTSIEQSKKLLELGIDVNTADMFYCNGHVSVLQSRDFITVNSRMREIYPEAENYVPTWSLASLIKLMPDKISINNESYYLSFKKKSVEFRGPITWDGQKSKSFEMDNILDAAFEMVCWLKENGKI